MALQFISLFVWVLSMWGKFPVTDFRMGSGTGYIPCFARLCVGEGPQFTSRQLPCPILYSLSLRSIWLMAFSLPVFQRVLGKWSSKDVMGMLLRCFWPCWDTSHYAAFKSHCIGGGYCCLVQLCSAKIKTVNCFGFNLILCKLCILPKRMWGLQRQTCRS